MMDRFEAKQRDILRKQQRKLKGKNTALLNLAGQADARAFLALSRLADRLEDNRPLGR
jgi:hypothetical protein